MGFFLDEVPGWVTTLTGAMKNIINPILILAATAGIIYAVVVGIRFVRAEDKGARDEAKQKLITVIVGIVVTLALIGLFYWLASALENGDIGYENWITGSGDKKSGDGGFVGIRNIVTSISFLLK